MVPEYPAEFASTIASSKVQFAHILPIRKLRCSRSDFSNKHSPFAAQQRCLLRESDKVYINSPFTRSKNIELTLSFVSLPRVALLFFPRIFGQRSTRDKSCIFVMLIIH